MFGELLNFILVVSWPMLHKVVNYLVHRVLCAGFQENELIRNDTTLLESECLSLGSGKTLNNPGLVRVFIGLDLFLNEVDHDLVVDYSN